MRLRARERLEDCFDGSRTYRYRFDRPWDRAAIEALRPLGRLDYFPDFPRPFFRLFTRGLVVKGVEGQRSCRVILTGERQEIVERELGQLLDLVAGAGDAPPRSRAA